ncbi:MAG: hypothetical protein QW804_05650 [Candidatus Bathyarchaeia archaeon]
MSNSFEEALLNIDVFCSVLVKKIMGGEEARVEPEPIEKMLRKKHTVEVYGRCGCEEPLIDIFEDEKNVKVLIQHLFRGREIEIHPNKDCVEIWINRSQKIKLPLDPSDLNKTAIKWGSQFLEIIIQK